MILNKTWPSYLFKDTQIRLKLTRIKKGLKMREQRRLYPKEFKTEAVELLLGSAREPKELAGEGKPAEIFFA